jgi:hypothetical protein
MYQVEIVGPLPPDGVAEFGTGWGIWLSLLASLAVSCLAGYLLGLYRRQAKPYALRQVAYPAGSRRPIFSGRAAQR